MNEFSGGHRVQLENYVREWRIWLVELLVCGILVLFFLFYFNRLFATLVSYGLRAYTWHKFRVYIDIQSLQISLLGGRIFFKGFRYHGENETIFVQNGYLTWQYWLHAVRQVDLVRYDKEAASGLDSDKADATEKTKSLSEDVSDTETGGIKEIRKLPCRVAISISGLEWFVYNKSPAYDAIAGHAAQRPDSEGVSSYATGTDFEHSSKSEKVHGTRAHVSKHETNSSAEEAKSNGFTGKASINQDTDHEPSSPIELASTKSTHGPEASSRSSESSTPLILRVLPIWIECHKGAIVLGNDTTRAILTTTFVQAEGHIDASSSGPRDLYRQIFEFQFNHPVVQMKPNPDFNQSQTSTAERVLFESDPSPRKSRKWSVNWHLQRRKRKALSNLRNLLPYFRRSVASFHAVSDDEQIAQGEAKERRKDARESPWIGLRRYLDDDGHNDHAGWTNVEYAKFSSVLDCPSVLMNFYWDTPGQVSQETSQSNGTLAHHDINGCEAPAYGLDLVIRGGSINYGPWTDRLRAEIQNVFFPNPFQNVQPAQKLQSGSTRQSTVMKIHITIEQEVALRVPTRESSKDWQWKGRAGALGGAKAVKKHREKKHARHKKNEKSTLGPDIRPFGWLSFHVDPNSTVTYEMDLVPGTTGYSNHLELDLKGTRATSSVNHADLWRCGPQQLSCNLSNPLKWNELHTWTFSIHSHAMELFLLRDHMFLLTDLIGDFTSGSEPDFMTFVPFYYGIKLSFTNAKVYLNTNDANIIDNPCDLDDNTFLILCLEKLNGEVNIPLRNFSPVQSAVLFKADGHSVSMELSTPLWNTLHTFVSDHPIAVLKELGLDGSYNYKNSKSSTLTDTLLMNISGLSPKVYLHGFLIKYFMKMKDNYFGEFMHFKTLEEYQEVFPDGNVLEPEHHVQPHKDDELDVVLNVRADRSCALLPANIYSRKENVRFDILLVEADMRFTNYYMDLSVKSSPIEASLESLASEEVGASDDVSNTQLFVDGVNVYGHRLFGAPPTEPTYVCNWDFDVGKILGECSTIFLRTLANAGVSFAFTLDDHENTISISNTATIHDITFVRGGVESINLWFLIDDAALSLQTGFLDVSFNDWAGVYFSERVHVGIPNIVVAAIDHKEAVRHRGTTDGPVPTYACFETSVDLKLVERKVDFAKSRALQQHHVRFHDQRTHRTDWLLHDTDYTDNLRAKDRYKGDPPSMPVPFMPEPATEGSEEHQKLLGNSVQLEQQLHSSRRSSFLSLSASNRSHSQQPGSRSSSAVKAGISARSRQRRTDTKSHAREKQVVVPPDPENHNYSASGPNSVAATLTYSSPWASPWFPLQKVKLNKAELPRISSSAEKMPQNQSRTDDHDPFITFDEAPRTAHVSFLIELRPGLTGFCTPKLFDVVSTLVKELQPVHPIDYLDQVQVDTMSRILRLSKLKSKAHVVSDFRIHVPFLHLNLINALKGEQETGKRLQRLQRDQYDLVLSQVRTTFRLYDIVGQKEQGYATKRGVLVHTQADELYAAVSGQSDKALKDTASAQISIKDVDFWLGSQRKTNARLQVRSIEASTRGTQIEYLASLVHRTGLVADRIADDFKVTDHGSCLKHLVYHLTLEAQHLADPVFLTRPSYVLRAAGDHLRQNDSWKLISRLRYMYKSLPKVRQERIVAGAAGRHTEFPEDAERHVLTSFDQWRNWDHGNVQNSFLMERIWGKEVAMPSRPDSESVDAELVIGSIRLLLDPGPHQNECTIRDVDVAISTITPPSTHMEDPYKAVDVSQTISIRSYCSQFTLHLTWDLVDLVGDILMRFQPKATASVKPTNRLDSISPRGTTSLGREVHFVFGTDLGSISVDSINLTLKSAAEKLQVSLMHKKSPQQGEIINLVMSASSALAKFVSNDSPVLGWRLFLPVFHASQSSKHPAQLSDLRLAGICHKLRFDLKQDLIKAISVANRVINDEVELIYKLISRLKREETRSLHTSAETVPSRVNVHLAFFLDDYKLNFRMLPTLNYVISGEVARTSLSPGRNSTIQIDLDLKRHYHSFQLQDGQGRTNTSTLGIPPINGRVSLGLGGSIPSVEMELTLDKIKLEAAEVRSCLDTATGPAMVKLVADTKQEVQVASKRVKAIFASSKPPLAHNQDQRAPRSLHYAARVTLLGLVIHCSAPGLKSEDYSADLGFYLGLTTAILRNHATDINAIRGQTQFDVHVRRVGLELGRRYNGATTNYGKVGFRAHASGSTEVDEQGNEVQVYRASVNDFSVDLYAETAYLVVDVATFLQERIKSFSLPHEVKQIPAIRRLTVAGLSEKTATDVPKERPNITIDDDASNILLGSIYSLDLSAIQVRWIVFGQAAGSPTREQEDLVFSIRKIDLSTKREGSARLAITDLQLQMVPKSANERDRSANSALLPEVVFNVAYLSSKLDRRFAFQAAGKALDLRLASDFIVPASFLQTSLGSASGELRKAKVFSASNPGPSRKDATNILSGKRLASLLVDADFAGAVVNVQARRVEEQRSSVFGILKGNKRSRAGRYGQVVHGESATEATLRAPGVAFKVEYRDTGNADPSLSAEVKVAASSNVLYPSVVPLIIEISSSIKEIVGDSDAPPTSSVEQTQAQKYLSDASMSSGDPATILGRCKLNVGLWICQQEFTLSCQPIARVAATARFDSIFMTVNTVQGPSSPRFFALLINFNKLQASVQHVYSRESTASFDVDSIVMSLMNSKHVTANTGISAILSISPMNAAINAKQLQDFLLFREIWYPTELRHASTAPPTSTRTTKAAETQAYAVQRYQQVAAASAFPWNAVVSIQELKVQLDLGQGLGKPLFTITKLWASTKKNSDWEQNLCLGFEKMGVESTGRMSGFIELQNFHVRTSIRWPLMDKDFKQTPLVQASLRLDQLRVKVAFDYQPFAVADISTLEFLMYNVRPMEKGEKDRLVGILDGDKVQVFCTTSSAAQSVALYQAIEKLIQEKETDYKASLRELDKYLRRKSVFPSGTWTDKTSMNTADDAEDGLHASISLHTDVVVTLRAINLGAFPSTFFDNQILKFEATDAQARFAVSTRDNKIHSGLGLTVGQLRVALSAVNRANTQALGDVSVAEIVSRATGSRGGTIVKVPKVVVSMQTWQAAASNKIEYIFKSTFEGKIDVGWNYSRISFIRGMWSAHERALSLPLGKPLSQSALKITGGPQPDDPAGKGQEKITAVVNMPQSKFEYTALEPPIIDTPQLRDMGEATPPLEWIGLHRDRLPNVIHQIIIMSLLEMAKEVEDAYSSILGST